VVPSHHKPPAVVGAEFSNFYHMVDALLVEFGNFFLQGLCFGGVRLFFIQFTSQLEFFAILISFYSSFTSQNEIFLPTQ
jgi:hypothetical protein